MRTYRTLVRAGQRHVDARHESIIISFILDELVHEKERYKAISEELDQTFQELSGY